MPDYAILQWGDRRLHQPARALNWPIPNPAQETVNAPAPAPERQLQSLIDDLIALTLQHQGVGIAAPQVGLDQRLMIVASRPNGRYPDAPLMEPTAMVNPRLLDRSDREVGGWEGCLSVPEQRGWVRRADQIQVEYWDRWGDRQQTRLSGFIARIFQHELDHLDGILFPERLAAGEKLLLEVEFLQCLSRTD